MQNKNKCSKIFNIIPHRHCRWTVQLYSPSGANVCPHGRAHIGATWRIWLNLCFLRPTWDHNPNGKRSVQPFLHSSPQKVTTLQWATLSPKIAPSHGGSGPPSNTWFPGTTQVLNPNGTSIGSAVLAGLTSVTDRQTDRPCYSVGNNRPHLRT